MIAVVGVLLVATCAAGGAALGAWYGLNGLRRRR